LGNFTGTNPFEQFNATSGVMLSSVVYNPENNVEEFALLIKEDTNYIIRHDKPKMHLKTGIIKMDKVLVVPIMLLINNDFEMLYEGYFNYCAISDNKHAMNLWKNQDFLVTHMFNEQNVCVRQILCHNTIKDELHKIADILAEAPEWSMQDFDRAKEVMYKRYRSPEVLWNELK